MVAISWLLQSEGSLARCEMGALWMNAKVKKSPLTLRRRRKRKTKQGEGLRALAPDTRGAVTLGHTKRRRRRKTGPKAAHTPKVFLDNAKTTKWKLPAVPYPQEAARKYPHKTQNRSISSQLLHNKMSPRLYNSDVSLINVNCIFLMESKVIYGIEGNFFFYYFCVICLLTHLNNAKNVFLKVIQLNSTVPAWYPNYQKLRNKNESFI